MVIPPAGVIAAEKTSIARHSAGRLPVPVVGQDSSALEADEHVTDLFDR